MYRSFFWGKKKVVELWTITANHKNRHFKWIILVLFFVQEDPRVWAHWNHSFDVHYSCPGPVSCFSPSWVPSGWTVRVAAGAEGLMFTASFVYWNGRWHSLSTGVNKAGWWLKFWWSKFSVMEVQADFTFFLYLCVLLSVFLQWAYPNPLIRTKMIKVLIVSSVRVGRGKMLVCFSALGDLSDTSEVTWRHKPHWFIHSFMMDWSYCVPANRGHKHWAAANPWMTLLSEDGVFTFLEFHIHLRISALPSMF